MRNALAVIAVAGLAVVLYLVLRPTAPEPGPTKRGRAFVPGGRLDVGDAAGGWADAATWDAPSAEPREPRPSRRDSAGGRLTLELTETPAVRYGDAAWTEADRKYVSVIRGLDGVEYDPALGHAARELAAFYSLEGKMAPSGALWFVLNAAGAAEWDVLRTMLVTSDTSDAAIRKRVQELIGSERSAVRVGIGESYPIATPPRRYIAVLVSRGRLLLDPLSRSVRTDTVVTVSGTLPAGVESPTALTMSPDLKVTSLPVETSGRRFSVAVPTGGLRGALQLELIATRATGPHPLAQIELHVGEAVPTAYEGTWAPDESHIADAADAEHLAYALLDGDRWRFHLLQLQRDRRLDAIARAHSEDMRDSDFIGHVSQRTGAPADRIARAGYRAVYHSENIARNTSLWDAQSGLFHSLGHRQNILSTRATHVGIGVAVGSYNDKPVFYLTQLFARPPTPVDPRRAALELRGRMNEARARQELEPLQGDAALTAVAEAQAARSEATPRSVLDAAQARGLTRRGASAVVSTQSELDGWQLPPAALDERYHRVGIGVHQDLDANPPRLQVVVLLGG